MVRVLPQPVYVFFHLLLNLLAFVVISPFKTVYAELVEKRNERDVSREHGARSTTTSEAPAAREYVITHDAIATEGGDADALEDAMLKRTKDVHGDAAGGEEEGGDDQEVEDAKFAQLNEQINAVQHEQHDGRRPRKMASTQISSSPSSASELAASSTDLRNTMGSEEKDNSAPTAADNVDASRPQSFTEGVAPVVGTEEQEAGRNEPSKYFENAVSSSMPASINASLLQQEVAMGAAAARLAAGNAARQAGTRTGAGAGRQTAAGAARSAAAKTPAAIHAARREGLRRGLNNMRPNGHPSASPTPWQAQAQRHGAVAAAHRINQQNGRGLGVHAQGALRAAIEQNEEAWTRALTFANEAIDAGDLNAADQMGLDAVSVVQKILEIEGMSFMQQLKNDWHADDTTNNPTHTRATESEAHHVTHFLEHHKDLRDGTHTVEGTTFHVKHCGQHGMLLKDKDDNVFSDVEKHKHKNKHDKHDVTNVVCFPGSFVNAVKHELRNLRETLMHPNEES
ncbi:unnamed protein product [Amoebophrya sp. A120]|nr:unnamed protein product [Amoebophrya sp. A120]|eukprot:GSA120T00018273001.1